ncbi:MAG: DUF4349 domain-containing protein [Erysipelotrichaceae bacterium]|nr:DUF4349 domain-containing protein [Erysipelotrichaceae bacterium]
MKKLITLLLAVLLLCGCNGAMPSEAPAAYDYKGEMAMGTTAEMEEMGYSTSSYGADNSGDFTINTDPSKKIIYTGSMQMETKDFDKSWEALRKQIEDQGGYITDLETYNNNYSTTSYRISYIVVKIPKDNLTAFMEGAKDCGEVTSSTISANDVTEHYADTQARLTNYQAEEKRLLELLDKAENIGDMLEIESHLNDVRYNIERCQTTLMNYDRKIEYSTVDISLREVVIYSSQTTFISRLSDALGDSAASFVAFIQDLIIFVIYAIPYVVVFAAVWFIFRKLVKKIEWKKLNPFRRKKESSASKEE